MSNALHGRSRVAPIARRHQQARASVPWVAPQLQVHAQPGQLVRAFGRGPPPHAGTQHRPARPPCTARPTRRAPSRSQVVRWSWPCAAAQSRALCRLRAGRVARVEHAETARVRHWAAPPRPTTPGRRVACRTDRRRCAPALALPCAPRGALSTQPPSARTATNNRRRRRIIREDVGSSRSTPTRERPRRMGLHERVCALIPTALSP